MKAFVCIVLMAAAALAAPAEESKRDKRGYLHDSYSLGYDHGFGHSDYSSGYIGGIELGHGYVDHSPIYHAPVYHAPASKVISINKVVEVPKVVHVKKVVTVPKVVSVPQVVKVSKIVEEPHYSYAPLSTGWW